MKHAVLIVDDDETDRYLLARQLKETQLVDKIFEAQDGEEALSFFREFEINRKKHHDSYPPLVVFLDINMPRVNGYGFLSEFAQLRKQAGLASVVIMMFSSSEQPEDMKRALEYQFVKEYLVKGDFDTNQLGNRLKTYF